MKKLLATSALFCVFMLSATGIAVSAEFNLKLQSYYAANILENMTQFAEDVKTMSNGRVEIQVFSGGELVSSSNILKAVKSGMVDMAQGMGHFYSEMVTGTLESGLPMSWTSILDAEILHERRGLREIFEKAYDKEGVVYLGSSRAGAYYLISKTPITSLDDLRKMKIRAVGASAKLLASLGVSIANIPSEDVYIALTTGQIDGALFGNAYDYKNAKFYEVAEYLNITPFLDPLTDSIIINKKVWNTFPEDIKAIFRSAAQNANYRHYVFVEDESLKVIDTIFKDKVTQFSEEDIAQIHDAATKLWESEAERSPEFAEGVEKVKEFATQKANFANQGKK